LRLLHRERDEIVIGRVDVGGAGGRELARQFARVELDWLLAATDRQAHPGAFGVERLDLGREADHRDLVTAKQQLRGQQRPVGSA
jgi:hypothetical protein